MTTVRVFNAARMQEIEDEAIVSGAVVGGHLYLTRNNGTSFDAGAVAGADGAGVGPFVPDDVFLQITNSATQSLADDTSVTFDETMLEDTDTASDFAEWSDVDNRVNILVAGWYQLEGEVSASGTTLTGWLWADLEIDGNGSHPDNLLRQHLGGKWVPFIDDAATNKFEGFRYMDEGSYIKLRALQKTGESVNIYNTSILVRKCNF